MAIWTFVRLTLREASRSRLLALAGVLTLLYVGLIAWGMAKLAENMRDAVQAFTAGAGLEVLAFFGGSFMLTLLAVFVSGHSTHQEGESGMLQAVLTKPVRRFDLLAGRWLASALMLAVWVALFTAGLIWSVGLQVGYYPAHPWLAGELLLLQALVILSLRLLCGAFLGTLASGIVPLLIYGFAWMGGMVETVGHALNVDAMVNGGIVTSLLIPTDAVWRGASYFLLPQVSALASTVVGVNDPARGVPFFGVAPIATPMVVWTLLYTAAAFLLGARIFSKRDI
ncbi:MAG: ABC transporter permease [Chloroflexi bacterium]|nr:ABC transporter permease [Chloroflexota bacterium]